MQGKGVKATKTEERQKTAAAPRQRHEEVFEEELEEEHPRRSRKYDGSELLANSGMYLILVSAGAGMFLINGQFSVQGLEPIASQFNEGGRIAMEIANSITFPLLGRQIPILPWLVVTGISLLQIAITRRVKRKKNIKLSWIIMLGICCAYDYGTSYFGIAATPWMQEALLAGAWGKILHHGLTTILTFGMEILTGILLPEIRFRLKFWKHRR